MTLRPLTMRHLPGTILALAVVLCSGAVGAGQAAAVAGLPSEQEREAAKARMDELDKQLAAAERRGEDRDDIAAIRAQLRQARTTYERLERAADAAEGAAGTLEQAGTRIDDLDRRWDDAVDRARTGDLSDLRPSNRTLALILGGLWLMWRLRRLRFRRRPG